MGVSIAKLEARRTGGGKAGVPLGVDPASDLGQARGRGEGQPGGLEALGDADRTGHSETEGLFFSPRSRGIW